MDAGKSYHRLFSRIIDISTPHIINTVYNNKEIYKDIPSGYPMTSEGPGKARMQQEEKMKFSVENLDLNKALSVVSHALPQRAAIPVLECVFINAEGAALTLKTSDTELSIITSIPAEVQEEGTIMVPMRTLYDLVRTYPNERVFFYADESYRINIKCSISDVDIPGQNPADYPSFKAPSDSGGVLMDNEVFRDIVRETVFACASLTSLNPVLTGVFIETGDDGLSFTALDGFKLATRFDRADIGSSGGISAIVPGRALNEILKIAAMYDNEPVRFFSSSGRLNVFIGQTVIMSSLIEGTYINYRALIPNEVTSVVKADVTDLLSSISRASLLTDESRNSLIKMDFSERGLVITSSSSKGRITENVSVEKNGEDITIAFNSRYFIDILKNIRDERIVIEFKDQLNPCLIKPVDSDRFLYMIMPVRYTE